MSRVTSPPDSTTCRSCPSGPKPGAYATRPPHTPGPLLSAPHTTPSQTSHSWFSTGRTDKGQRHSPRRGFAARAARCRERPGIAASPLYTSKGLSKTRGSYAPEPGLELRALRPSPGHHLTLVSLFFCPGSQFPSGACETQNGSQERGPDSIREKRQPGLTSGTSASSGLHSRAGGCGPLGRLPHRLHSAADVSQTPADAHQHCLQPASMEDPRPHSAGAQRESPLPARVPSPWWAVARSAPGPARHGGQPQPQDPGRPRVLRVIGLGISEPSGQPGHCYTHKH